jgi:hypothetical protein
MGHTGQGPIGTSNYHTDDYTIATVTQEMWNEAVEINKALLNRLDKAEYLLHRVLNHNELSPGQWMSLILDIVKFKPKGS